MTRSPLVLLVCWLLASCGGGGGGGGGIPVATPPPIVPVGGGMVQPPTGDGACLTIGVDGTVGTLAEPPPPAGDRLVFARSAASGIHVGVHPVTREQWQALMRTTPWTEVPADIVEVHAASGLPAYNIAHDEALACAATLAARSGLAVRLPHAAVWRAEIGIDEYPWGASRDPEVFAAHAVTAETRSIPGPEPVGTRRPSAGGIHDLIGNTRQWTLEGLLVGGSWSDGILQAGRSHAVGSVPASERHPLSGLRLVVEMGRPAINHAPVLVGEVTLPTMLRNLATSLDQTLLLAGAVDPDGDTLAVVGLGSTQAAVAGAKPWSLVPAAAGMITVSYLVVDGRGGIVHRTAQGIVNNPPPPPDPGYDRYQDTRGLYRYTNGDSYRYVTVPSVDISAASIVEYEFGFRLDSFDGHAAGTPVDASFSSGSNSFRSLLRFATDGRITITDEAKVKRVISVTDGPRPGQIWHCRLRIDPAGSIQLWRRIDDNWRAIGSVASAGFRRWSPTRLLVGESGLSCNATVYYWKVSLDGRTMHDLRFDEMLGTSLGNLADNLAAGAANVEQAKLEWRDDMIGPDPVVDFTVTGALVHGGSLMITAPRPLFPGGRPSIQLYDDGTRGGVPRSGPVDTAPTIEGGGFIPWSLIKKDDDGPTQTYKPGGPGGRSFTVDFDGVTKERLSRGVNLPDGFSEVFVSRSLRVPADRSWPGSTDVGKPWVPVPGYIPSDSTWKSDWMLTADDTGHTGSDFIIGTHAQAEFWSFGGNSVSRGNPDVQIRLRPVIAFGEWFSVRGYIRHDPARPEASPAVSSLSTSRVGTVVCAGTGFVLNQERGFIPFRLWLSGAWLDEKGEPGLCLAQRADVYAAFGPHAACRVEIGDSYVYARCTALAACPPLSWQEDRIEVRCALGIFDPAVTPLYAFVIGADGLPILPYGKRLAPR